VPTKDVAPVRITASVGAPDAQLLRDGHFDQAFVLPMHPRKRQLVAIRLRRAGDDPIAAPRHSWPKDHASAMPDGSVMVATTARHSSK